MATVIRHPTQVNARPA